jgi:drug/metabolite transporter (DMT)-like permease
MPPVGGQRYITSTAVFLTEVIKFGVCMTAALFEMAQEVSPSLPATSLFQYLAAAVFSGDSWKLAIPAALYTVQHSLQYVAVSNLDAATLQVTYQFKILPTAIFSILILRRTLTAQKWAALALLMFGVALVQMPAARHPAAATALKDAHSRMFFPRSFEDLKNWGYGVSTGLHKRSATYEGIEEDMLIQDQERNDALGFASAILSCTASALGSVYFEKILKEATSKVSIWIRNVQLSVYSIIPSLFIGVVFVDGAAISKNGFFVGYNWIVWQVILLQALGGIIVALCIHYTNNITKSFATSISILLSLFFSMILFNFTFTTNVSRAPLKCFYSNIFLVCDWN